MEPFINAFGELAHRAFDFALNGIWPGLLLTGLVWIAWRFVRFASAGSRYLVWWAVLVTSIAAPLILAGIMSWSENQVLPPTMTAEEVSAYPVIFPTNGASPIEAGNLAPIRRIDSPTSPTPVVAETFRWVNLIPAAAFSLWLIVASVLIVRLGRAFFEVRRIKRQSQPFDLSALSDYLLRLLAAGTRRGPVSVRLSSEIATPVAAGLGRPTILIPHRIAAELSDREIKAVILHELSHLRRWDDLTKLLQKVIEALFFFHPAIHLIGRELELERELACDEWAVARTGARDDYARCLTRLVQLTHGCATTLIPGVLSGRRQIFKRFQRLLLGERPPAGRYRGARLLGVMSIVVGVFMLAVHLVPAIAAPFDVVTLGDLQYAWSGPAPDSDDDDSDISWERRQTDLERATFARQLQIERAQAARARAQSSATARTAPAPRVLAPTFDSGNRYLDLRSFHSPKSGLLSFGSRKGNANSVWTDDDRTVTIATVGETVFERDRMGIRSITDNGRFELREEQDGGSVRFLQVTADDDGDLTYHYEVNGRPEDFDRAGGEWLAEMVSEALDINATEVSSGSMRTDWYSYDDDGEIWIVPDADDLDGYVIDVDDLGGYYVYDDAGDISATGQWRADARRARSRIELQLRGDRGRSRETLTLSRDRFKGWKDEWQSGDHDTAHFEYVADAGTAVFDGRFQDGRGRGKYHFETNEAFLEFLEKYGCRRSEFSDNKLWALVIFDVDRAFVEYLSQAGFSGLSLDELVELRIHGADPDYLNELKAVGYGDIGHRRLVEFLVHDVDPDDIRAFQEAGFNRLSPADLVSFRVHDVDPGDVKEFAELGYSRLDSDELIAFTIHNVTPGYVRELAEVGYRDLEPDLLLQFRIHDVTAGYVRRAQKRGFADLSPEDLLELKIRGR